MEKTTLLKIIKTVRELEIKKNVNDSKFDYYSKKKKTIDYNNRKIQNEICNLIWNVHTNETTAEKLKKLRKKQDDYNKQTMKEFENCLIAMDKLENENKVINKQIEQYLINYVAIEFIFKLNKMKTFSYKKLDNIFKQIEKETNRIHKFNGSSCSLYIDGYYNILTVSFGSCNNTHNLMSKTKDYIESHLTKKTITKAFSINDFSKKIIDWNMKTPEEEVQYNDQIKDNLKNLKMQITKLLNEYNQERTKLTIDKEYYQYIFIR